MLAASTWASGFFGLVPSEGFWSITCQLSSRGFYSHWTRTHSLASKCSSAVQSYSLCLVPVRAVVFELGCLRIASMDAETIHVDAFLKRPELDALRDALWLVLVCALLLELGCLRIASMDAETVHVDAFSKRPELIP